MLDTINNLTAIFKSLALFAFWGSMLCAVGILFVSACKAFFDFLIETLGW